MGATRGHDPKTQFPEQTGWFQGSGLVAIGDGEQDSSFSGQGGLGGLLGFEKGPAKGVGQTQDFPGRTHLRAQGRVDAVVHVEGEDGLLDAVMRNVAGLQIEVCQRLAQHDLGSQTGHGDVAYF